MVFLGGAVLANLVCLSSPLPFTQSPTNTIPLDRRQGRYVGEQAGVAGAGCPRPGQARPAINALYLGGFGSGSCSAPYFSLISCFALFASHVVLCLFSYPHFFPPSLSIYSRQSCGFSPVSFPASYIVPRLVWCRWIWDSYDRKELNISIRWFGLVDIVCRLWWIVSNVL
jgi:hypothetical protein